MITLHTPLTEENHHLINADTIAQMKDGVVIVNTARGALIDSDAFIDAIENVIECNCVTGEYAMLLEVEFWNTVELDHFINDLQRFGKTRTQIVFSTAVEHRNLPVRIPFIEKAE